MSTRRFSQGSQILTIGNAMIEIEFGKWLMFRFGSNERLKPQHPGFVMSMSVRTLYGFIKSGRVFRAIDRDDQVTPWLKTSSSLRHASR